MLAVKDRSFFLMEAVIFMLLGIIAIAVPVLFTFSLTVVLGILLLIAGGYQLARLWKHRSTSGFWSALFSSIVNLAVGILLLLHPIAGMITLTLLFIIYFFLIGLIQILWAWQLRHYAQWGWILLSALLSLLLGGLVLAGLPESALWALGLFFGINLLFTGIALWNVAWNMPTLE